MVSQGVNELTNRDQDNDGDDIKLGQNGTFKTFFFNKSDQF